MTDPPIPGLTADRDHLSAQARALVQHALDSGTPLGLFVLHLQPDAVTWERRDRLADDLRHAGVRDLAKKLRAAVVPRDHVLLLIATDETALRLLPLRPFIEERE